MSVHSLNELDDSYKGYKIDENGGVTEIYDHRENESTVAPSSARVPLVHQRPPTTTVPPSSTGYPRSQQQQRRPPKRPSAGFCGV